MREFIINDYITLRLEDNKTVIYVNNEVFSQCKYLLLNIPIENIEEFEDINSIDETIEVLDHRLENRGIMSNQISPETEFWGHCLTY
ncbi:hypothetical protein LCGC14_2622200 [marine sediment metagenome]|uniref:Uncharacterized protein n=1 Tax=marine sediment metagenome TaxID=412755 RepID=A0A0F9A2N7_9ZZZZ